MAKGSCECGAVAFEVSAPVKTAVACHCSQCRKTSGHFWAGTLVDDDCLMISKSDGLKWYRSSDFARRGFCTGCGSSLFYQMDNEGKTSVAAGTFDDAQGMSLCKHIFVGDKGDYYEIGDDVEQLEKF